jgi:hypothetical protein
MESLADFFASSYSKSILECSIKRPEHRSAQDFDKRASWTRILYINKLKQKNNILLV